MTGVLNRIQLSDRAGCRQDVPRTHRRTCAGQGNPTQTPAGRACPAAPLDSIRTAEAAELSLAGGDLYPVISFSVVSRQRVVFACFGPGLDQVMGRLVKIGPGLGET